MASKAAATTDAPNPGALRLALWFGLLTGCAVLAILGYSKFLRHRYLHATPDTLWMAPLSCLLFFVVPGLLLWLLARVRPQWGALRLLVSLNGFLAALFILYMPVGLHRVAAVALAAGVGFQLGRMAAARPALTDRLVRLTLPLGLGILLTLTVGTIGYGVVRERRALARLGPAAPGAPNVLLLVLDTVRARSLGLYGFIRPTSPELTRLAATGVRFEQATSTAPWTLPSHASLMTGRWAHELSSDWRRPLDDTYPTLAEQLAAHGYATAGFVGNTWYCGVESGLGRGFGHYEDVPRSFWSVVRSTELGKHFSNFPLFRVLAGRYHKFGRKGGAGINAALLDWVDAHRDRPFFAFVNYFDAHGPYDPPAPYDSLFGATVPRENPDLRPTTSWDPTEIAAQQRAYEGSIAYLDHLLGQLFDELERRGLRENTIIVVTADHGEEFHEHGVMEHGNSVYRAGVHVPLIVSWPARVPARVTVPTTVSLREVPRTLSSLATGDPGPFPGRSLSRFWTADSTPGSADGDTILVSVSAAPGLPDSYPVSAGPLRSVQFDGYRYITDGRGREELYDAVRDTLERQNLAADPTQQDRLARYRAVAQGMGTQ